MNITEFLEARIEEDEARAGSGWARRGDTRWEVDNYGQNFLTPTAVLAECAAKRAIMEHAVEASGDRATVTEECELGESARGEAYASDPGLLITRALAAVYKDHPDYQKEWAL